MAPKARRSRDVAGPAAIVRCGSGNVRAPLRPRALPVKPCGAAGTGQTPAHISTYWPIRGRTAPHTRVRAHNRAVTDSESPRRGSMRFTRAGDIEIFDGTSWQPVEPLAGEAGLGDRGEPPVAPSDASKQSELSEEDPQQTTP